MKRTKHKIKSVAYAMTAMAALAIIVWFVLGTAKVRAIKLYKNEDFRESACQLYSWMEDKGKNAIICIDKTYYSEDEDIKLVNPLDDYSEFMFQNGIWHICYFDGLMELQIDRVFSGRVFSLWLSAEALPEEKSWPDGEGPIRRLIGKYSVNDSSSLYVYYYEGYIDTGDDLERKVIEQHQRK